MTTFTTPVKSSSDLIQIAINLPKSHLRILDTEAGMYGLRRSQFIELLFLNKIGHRSLVRLDFAPVYQFGREELSETERFVIYVRPEVKKLFDEHLLKLGMKTTAWVVNALNDWVGITESQTP